jgi:hypothetical protein
MQSMRAAVFQRCQRAHCAERQAHKGGLNPLEGKAKDALIAENDFALRFQRESGKSAGECSNWTLRTLSALVLWMCTAKNKVI